MRRNPAVKSHFSHRLCIADSESCVPDGYVAVDHVELDIKEMLELGKRAAVNRNSTGNLIEAEVTSTGSRYVCNMQLLTQYSLSL